MTGDDLQARSAVELQILDRLQPAIRPRSDWGEALPPTGPLTVEDEVRFLMVHHTASNNDYGPDDVVDEIREFYDLHVGPTRGWSDVAYNFLIDRFGGIWEGRQGSLTSPIRGDATGGSQGFALLCSLIGNHVDDAPTKEATDSLARLLAWLAQRHDIDTSPGATVDFTSRGSSRWALGTAVSTRTIAGHRDMSLTTCPGSHLYSVLENDLPLRVESLRTDVLRQFNAVPHPQTAVAEETTMDLTAAEATISSSEIDDEALSPRTGTDDDLEQVALPIGAAAALAAVGGLIAFRRRRLG